MDGPFAGCTVEGGLEIVWALDRQGVQRDSRRPCGGLRGTKLEFADGGIDLAGSRQLVCMARARHGLGRFGAGVWLGPNRRRPNQKQSDFARPCHQ